MGYLIKNLREIVFVNDEEANRLVAWTFYCIIYRFFEIMNDLKEFFICTHKIYAIN